MCTIEERLEKIFTNVNEWLKFAEAKHAGLLILNSGAIFGAISAYKDYALIVPFQAFIFMVAFMGFSMLLTFISLFPKTTNSIGKRKTISNPNLFFFGHLALLSEEEFISALKNIDPTYQVSKFDKDIINQIIVNSSITNRKYKLFKSGVVVTIIGMFAPLLFLLTSYLICHYYMI